MTTPEKPSTAVAKPKAAEQVEQLATKLLALAETPQERAAAFTQLTLYRQSQMIRESAAAIASMTWGRDLSPYARAAIARYALETGTDPVRHWEVLGNKLYDTAQLWFDLAASMADYNGYEAEDLSWNDGLDETGVTHRRSERAKFGLPQDVKGACVVRIYRKGIERPFIGANHAGNRMGYNAKLKRSEHNAAGDTIPDPVGEQDPGKTAFTRAFRRAAKTAWPIWPYRGRAMPSDDGVTVTELAPGAVEQMERKDEIEGVLQRGQESLKEHPPQRPDGWDAKPVKDPTDSPDPYAETNVRAEDERLARE
jgi:hypothetical protein